MLGIGGGANPNDWPKAGTRSVTFTRRVAVRPSGERVEVSKSSRGREDNGDSATSPLQTFRRDRGTPSPRHSVLAGRRLGTRPQVAPLRPPGVQYDFSVPNRGYRCAQPLG